MKAGLGFMNWDIPNPTCGERAPNVHTHPAQMPRLLITLYHLQPSGEAKRTPRPGPSEVRRRCRNISQNKTFITSWFSAAHILAKA